MNSDRDSAHRVAKPRRIEALTWHGAYFRASVLGFSHVLTVLLLHRNYLYFKDCDDSFPCQQTLPHKNYAQPREPQAIAIHRGDKPDLLIAREGAFDASALSLTGSDRRRCM